MTCFAGLNAARPTRFSPGNSTALRATLTTVARIIGLLQRGAIQEIRTFEKSYLPERQRAHDCGRAWAWRINTSATFVVNIRRGIREKVRRGIFCGKAPLGYYNEPRLRTIEPHPEHFKKVKRILEAFRHRATFRSPPFKKNWPRPGLSGKRSRKTDAAFFHRQLAPQSILLRRFSPQGRDAPGHACPHDHEGRPSTRFRPRSLPSASRASIAARKDSCF